jgi:hypothetical protein
MLSLSLVWHIAWFLRLTLSLALFLVVVTRKLYEQFPLFAVLSGWETLAGITVLGINYAPFLSGNQYFTAVAIENGVEAVLAFAVI